MGYGEISWLWTLVITDGPPSIPRLPRRTFYDLLFGFYVVALIFELPRTVFRAFC